MMIKKIQPDNKIFNSNEFLKDKVKFQLILQNLDSVELELYSDEENYILCRGSKKLPTWIWTRDNIDKSLIKEIEEVIDLYRLGFESRFTAKRELYELLVKDKYKSLGDYYFEMGFLECKNLIIPKKCDGYIEKLSLDDKDIITKFIYEESRKMDYAKELSYDESVDIFNKLIEEDSSYVWKNENNKIVAQAKLRIVGNNAKVAGVYTDVSERGKGYAANLVYVLTKKALNNGYSASLYTDYKYIPSNKAYKNVGYVDSDILINFSCIKK